MNEWVKEEGRDHITHGFVAHGKGFGSLECIKQGCTVF